jgi:hypothetical protein
MKLRSTLHATTLALSLLAAGCATAPKAPIQRADGFRPETMDKVYLLPLVDARVDKKLTKDYNKQVQKRAADALKRLRYQREVVAQSASTTVPAPEDLRQPAADTIKQAGPANARWLMVFVLEEVSRKLVFLGSTGNAELSMYILDKQAGAVVWHDKAVSQVGQGGLLGMIGVSAMDGDALRLAVFEILGRVPKHPKTRQAAPMLAAGN